MINIKMNIITNYKILIVFILILFFLWILLPISILTLGGLYLLVGALYIYYGNIFYSVILYTVADICWLYNAFQNTDYFGILSIALGIIVGLIVTYKMNKGIFQKSLLKD